jgi:hypothetical protein
MDEPITPPQRPKGRDEEDILQLSKRQRGEENIC